MENNTSFGREQTDSFNEVVEIGLNSSAEILSKLLNNEAEFKTQQLNQEQIKGLESFGEEPGLAVAINISGAINGKASVIVQNIYVKEILNLLMSADDSGGESSDELDEIAIGTFKELVGQMAGSFSDSITNFLGADVSVEAGDTDEISDECDEVADFLGCSIEDQAYSLVNSFEIKNVVSGVFVIVFNEDAVVNTIGRVMNSESDDADQYNNYEDNGFDNYPSNMSNGGGRLQRQKRSVLLLR